ncbi:MAG: DUF4153 domain-containing protein [Bacteroidaceae bacterium]|nr:DUF4153 domain-containing protein [Bacteroidaceae bacterium]
MSCEAFRQTDAAQSLQHYRKNNPLTSDQRRQVMTDVHRLFGETEAYLRECHPALTDEDVELCLLSALQCPASAMADCLSVSEEAVRVRKHRMKAKLPREVQGVFWEERAGARLLKTLFMKDTVQNVWRRFPLAVIWLVLLTVYAVWLCWAKAPSDSNPAFLMSSEQRAALFYGLGMAVVLATTLRLWGEEVRRPPLYRWVTLVAHLLLMADVVWLMAHPDAFERTGALVARLSLMVALAVAFFYAPFFREKDDLPVWNFTWRTFLWFCISFLTGGILTAGLLALIRSLEELFGLQVSEHWYLTFVVIALLTTPVLLFLARIPEGDEKHDGMAVISKYLIFVIRYLFVPLLALYLIVLYVYGFRILIRWELPNGGVGWLVSALMAGCVVVELGLYPVMRSGEAKPFERWIVRWLPVLILPLLLLMTVGIARRLSDYGITPLRLYLLTFNLWCYAVCIGLVVGRARRIRWIMTSLAAVFLLTSLLPVNFTSISLRVRRHNLDRLVENTLPITLPMDDEAMGAWITSLDDSCRKQVWDELDFLLDTDRRSVADLTSVKHMYPFASPTDAEHDELSTIDYSAKGPFALPEGYVQFHDEIYTYLKTEGEDAVQVTPDGFWIEQPNADDSAKIPLFIGKNQILSCTIDAEKTTPLLCYSADSTYVLVVTRLNLRMNPDNTPSSGNVYGYLLSK